LLRRWSRRGSHDKFLFERRIGCPSLSSREGTEWGSKKQIPSKAYISRIAELLKNVALQMVFTFWKIDTKLNMIMIGYIAVTRAS
jgi:hypothetical protein